MKKDIFKDSRIFWNSAQVFIYHYLPDIRKASHHTVLSYKDGLNGFISYLEDEKKIQRKNICFEHFSEDVVKEYQDWLLNTKGKSPKTCNLRLTALRSFLEYVSNEHSNLTSLYVGLREFRSNSAFIPVFLRGYCTLNCALLGYMPLDYPYPCPRCSVKGIKNGSAYP